MDEIVNNHPGKLKRVGPCKYTCNCGAVFDTTSYRKRNFLNHLSKDEKFNSKTPWIEAETQTSANIPPSLSLKIPSEVTPRSSEKTPSVCQPLLDSSIVCDGFWLRQVDGVDITDRYHVRVNGQNGFYGVPHYKSHREIIMTGTFKSNLCLSKDRFD